MKRTIIEIDESLCTGCEQCVDACAEGAIQMVDGVARVVKEQYCDGLGACIGDCPAGALRLVEREAEAYDAGATEQHVRSLRGEAGVSRFRAEHAAHAHPPGHTCPGSAMRLLSPASQPQAPAQGSGLPPVVQRPDLAQWPVQLHLVPVRAPFFAGKELVVLSTCAPVASADVHWRFLRGRSCVVACPKLDRTEPYVQKLAAIFSGNAIPKVLVVRMQVPCCGGLSRMTLMARELSGRADLEVEEVVVGVDGAVQMTRAL